MRPGQNELEITASLVFPQNTAGLDQAKEIFAGLNDTVVKNVRRPNPVPSEKLLLPVRANFRSVEYVLIVSEIDDSNFFRRNSVDFDQILLGTLRIGE